MRGRIWLLLPLLAVFSCVRETTLLPEREGPSAQVFGMDIPEDELVPDVLNVCFDDETVSRLESLTGEDGEVRPDALPGFEGVVRMHRLFPDAGKFEARTREAGLHRWYEVYYQPGVSITKAAAGAASFPGVEEVELNPRIEIVGHPEVVEVLSSPARASASSKYPFDDPRLSSQWQYYNNGTAASAVSGCDINVFPVWRTYKTGDPSVIVGVVDGGIDFRHEDLAANMWNNPEKSGDYKYGYNFTNNTFAIHPEDHGTHVAGTIAAVNNNGKGVCGIAGGNAATGEKGVKLMSCQIFDGNRQGSGAAAIKWSADHGAVISQNSWGYTTLTEPPSTLRSAVDYFIAHAGMDEKGRQTGPMKGGIVIFAAGNEDASVSGNDYGPIFNVASVGADFRRAYYSNYGSWVDIAAPGGDARKGNQILSTLPGGRYGIMQGTSMACPHVSGVAALIVSQYAASGSLTAENLEKKLLSGVTSISSFNPNYALGAGLVNAYRSIAGSGGKAPQTPSDLTLSVQSNNVRFSVRVPKDVDDGVPTTINLYYSTGAFDRVSPSLMFARFYVEDLNEGDLLEAVVTGLEFEREYYLAAAAVDLAGNISPLTARQILTTGSNHAPEIVELTAPSLVLKPHESGSMDFRIDEPDGHFYTIELSADSEGVVLDTLVRACPKVKVSGPSTPSGSYRAVLTVTDNYGLSARKEMQYTVLENHPPTLSGTFPDRIFSSRTGGTEQLDCSLYFSDEDGEQLSYSFSISNETVVNMTAQDGKFFLTPMNYGYSDVTVKGTDVRGESVEQAFRVLVRDGSRTVEMYPNPVRDKLYIRMASQADVSVSVVSVSGAVWFEGVVPVAPFAPAVVDMSGASPGAYTVYVTLGSESFRQNLMKL